MKKRIFIISILLSIFLFIFCVFYYLKFETWAQVYDAYGKKIRFGGEIQIQRADESGKADAVKIPILVYHSVRPYTDSEPPAIDQFDVTPELFEKQIRYLKDNGFTTASVDDFVSSFKGEKVLPEKTVVITFDDGWENQYTYAFPILKKYGYVATFFIYTNAVDYRHYLTWQQVQELVTAGMQIGSHTVSHPYLNKLSEEKLKDEIFKSKKMIEHRIGKPVTAFASPFGYSNPDIISLLKEAGYTSGRTMNWGVNHSKDDLLQLTSVSVGDSLDAFINLVKITNRGKRILHPSPFPN